jgi:hypothetical protein
LQQQGACSLRHMDLHALQVLGLPVNMSTADSSKRNST